MAASFPGKTSRVSALFYRADRRTRSIIKDRRPVGNRYGKKRGKNSENQEKTLLNRGSP